MATKKRGGGMLKLCFRVLALNFSRLQHLIALTSCFLDHSAPGPLFHSTDAKKRSAREGVMQRLKFAVVCAGVALLLTTCSRNLAAQGLFGSISGIVTDSTGAVVADAAVKVTNYATNITTTWKTNSAGVYNATSLNPGIYRIEAVMSGFKTAVASNILLEVNSNPKVNLTLSVGQITETVEVAAENIPILQTQQTDLGQTLDSTRLEQLPTQSGSGRSPYSFLVLAAGVSQQFGCSGGGGGVGGCGNQGNVRISGSRPRNDDNILDGTSITPPVFGGQGVSPTVEAIQEFRVEQNSMSAEYGKAGGAIIIQVSKSGTDHFHGSAYEYNRNQKLDAEDFFVEPGQPKNPFTYDEFGGSIGGPIIKGKLFFFTDYEGIRSHGSSPQAGVLVPDSNFRSGNLGAFCPEGFTNGVCNNSAHQIYFPGTSNPVPNNVITAISPVSAAIEAVWPTGGTAVGPGEESLTVNLPNSTSLNRFNPRVDWNLGQADHLFGAVHTEYGVFHSNLMNPGPSGRQSARSANYAITVGETHTFNPSTLNEFRFGYMHRIGDRTPYGAGATSPALYGIKGVPDCLSSMPDTGGGTKCGIPGFSVTGYSSFVNKSMLYEPASTFHFSDMLTKSVGRHSAKAGAQLDHYAIDNYQPNNVDGSFSFNGKQTGNAFADFLFGTMSGGSLQVQNAFVSSRAWSYAFFVQDDFRLSAKLTLNLGLRWQYDQSFHETHHGDAYFDPCATSYTGKDPACVPHWEQFGVNAPDTTFDPSKHEFGPRIGAAWNPAGGFVVRAGYGIMYPGYVGHGRAGDGQPGPNLLAQTSFLAKTLWDAPLPNVINPDPSAITKPIPINSDVSFSFWAPRKQPPTYTQLWNVTVQKQFGSKTVGQIGYVGSKGTHLPVNYAYNICQQTPASTAAQPNPFNFVGPLSSPNCPAAAAALNAGAGFSPGPVYYWLTILPGWWGLSNSIYHSMQAQFDHRFSHGFSLLANFTWSKLIDDSSSDWGGFWSLDVLGQDFYNRKAERSVSAGDVPRRLTLAPIVELPFGPGKRWLNNGATSNVLGGWRLAAIYTVSVGTPFGITDNSYGFCNGAGVLSDRSMMIGNPLPAGFHQTVAHWFNTSAFDFSGTCPAAGLVDLTGPFDVTKAFGNAPRYFSNIRNPGVNNFDFSLQKDFKIREQTRLTFSSDFFNLPNHPEFAEPNADSTNSNFGSISRTALNNRTIQLGLHLYF